MWILLDHQVLLYMHIPTTGAEEWSARPKKERHAFIRLSARPLLPAVDTCWWLCAWRPGRGGGKGSTGSSGTSSSSRRRRSRSSDSVVVGVVIVITMSSS